MAQNDTHAWRRQLEEKLEIEMFAPHRQPSNESAEFGDESKCDAGSGSGEILRRYVAARSGGIGGGGGPANQASGGLEPRVATPPGDAVGEYGSDGGGGPTMRWCGWWWNGDGGATSLTAGAATAVRDSRSKLQDKKNNSRIDVVAQPREKNIL
jgi:hypothetical protein